MLRQVQQSASWHHSAAVQQQWAVALSSSGALRSGCGIARLRAVALSIGLDQWPPVSGHSFCSSAPPPSAPPSASPPESAAAPPADAGKSTSPKDWPIIRRFAVESAVKSYGASTLADDIFVLHGPRGVGKRTAVKAVLKDWASPPHAVAHVDLYAALLTPRSDASPSPPWLNRLYPEAASSPSNESSASRAGLAHLSSSSSQTEEPRSKEHAVDGASMSPDSESFPGPAVFQPRYQRALRTNLELGLLSVVKEGIRRNKIKMEDIFWALTWRRHVDAALERHLSDGSVRSPDSSMSFRRLKSVAGPAYAELASTYEIFEVTDPDKKDASDSGPELVVKKLQFRREPDPNTGRLWLEALVNVPAVAKKQYHEPNQIGLALNALHLARQVLEVQEEWRSQGPGRGAADAATAWSVLMIDLLSAAAEAGTFEPKLVIHGIELLRQAPGLGHSRRKRLRHVVSGAQFHDQLILQLTERAKTLPVILTTSDGHYSNDFDTEQKFLEARVKPSEYFGWTAVEASVHLVPRLVSPAQWARLNDAVGLNARHLAEFHSLWAERAAGLTSAVRDSSDEGSHFDRTVVEYLDELERESFRPAMRDVVRRVAEKGREAWTARRSWARGLIRRWDDVRWVRWATLQVLDFLRALQRARYGVNYVNLAASEFLEDEVARALMSAGVLYQQRDPPYIRPVTKAFQGLMEAWLRDELVKLSLQDKVAYAGLRLMNGRYYRHLVKPSLGPKDFVMGDYRYV
ncbi:hypothetical protein KFL_001770230 [Klebsormidium nitens]|uniref:Uncharacterized protein n=1 Tax=Klebsormidium nitens TaxID=105231 RepID=A0A1Y1I5Y6_KLENI|nr:hypothetical protein KFL_001770230 [Klebsormidium nitens]|eukprot:GAQ84137.1 hypothetical protein KFL_001770230 [Klebsormidium nitens]